MKRLTDVFLASLLLALLLPLIIVLGLAVRFMLGSPVLFRQERIGLEEKPFNLLKFRTMNEPTFGDTVVLDDKSRLTRFGKFLRSTSLDELPELLNVLAGHMSLVGPRPLLPEYLPLYNTFQRKRHDVIPGITGWAQINGRNSTTWDRRFEMDVWYVENRTYWLDVRILARTLGTVLSRRGINANGHVTMSRFKGTRKQ